MTKLITDTSVIIDSLRQQKVKTPLRKIISAKSTDLYIPAVVITELYIGQSITYPTKKKVLEDFLKHFTVVLADKKISQLAGDLLRENSYLRLADAIITATCLHQKVPLYTFNTKHFALIPNLDLFTPQN